ncbi:tetratricopeptide repeat protein [Thermodesulfovibrio hydrogeniphilus]
MCFLLKKLDFLMVFCLLLIAGCSMPKILVLNDPLTAEEHLMMGLSREKAGLFDEAIKHYEEASKSDARGFLFLGNLYLSQNKYEEAEKNYKKAINKNDKLADAYNNLAWLYYLQERKLDEAEKLVKKAIELEINNPDRVKIYDDTLRKIQKLKENKSTQ